MKSLLGLILVFIATNLWADQATFAGGCFWCMQKPFDKTPGVTKTVVGYTGGRKANPTYGEVSAGESGHIESIQITYDPKKVSYEKLVDVFWHQIDPTDAGGQFADRGPQYSSAIFYHNDEQKKIAEESKGKLDASKKFSKPVATVLRKASPFYPAEDYHQQYYLKNPPDYDRYYRLSGRKAFIEKHWK